MKKIAFMGIVLFLLMFLWTCDFGSPEDVVVEYTDVEYSEDGSSVTVYLDGSKPVPVTKAQRAMTTNLAKMAYDYIEVLFVSTENNVVTRARSSWELGQSAGISGVARNGKTGVNYLYDSSDDGSDNSDANTSKALALMFVGRKDGKTLLGVGRILQVDHEPKVNKPVKYYASAADAEHVATTYTDIIGLPATDTDRSVYAGTITRDSNGNPKVPTDGYYALINDDTNSVTFWIEAVKTGLLIKKELLGAGADDTAYGKRVAYDSFEGGDPSDGSVYPGSDPTLTSDIRKNATRSPINNSRSSFPLYPLPEPTASNVGTTKAISATYRFGGGALTFKNQIMLDGLPEVEKRFPRYMDGGRYKSPTSDLDTETLITVDTVSYPAIPPPVTPPTLQDYAKFENAIPLKFTLSPQSYGLFSFYIEVPVFLFCRTDFNDKDPDSAGYTVGKTKPTNGGPDAIVWKIRTGLGPELYSLDDGLASGGCVLMGVGVSATDWLEIFWDFVK